MAFLAISPPPLSSRSSSSTSFVSSFDFTFRLSLDIASRRRRLPIAVASQLCTPETPTKLDKTALNVAEAVSDDELWAAACLRIRSFYNFQESFGIEDHKKYLAEREFEALKERIAGKRTGFGRVSCINATLPVSRVLSFSDDLCTACKYNFPNFGPGLEMKIYTCGRCEETGLAYFRKYPIRGLELARWHDLSALPPRYILDNKEDRVVVGTLDINQCIRLPDEITGKRPQGIGADFARAYLSNVCVAKELHRNGLGYVLIAKSKEVAEEWGISDLYVHVAVDNEPAKKLYLKSGFVYENDEPAWQARFLDRPRRLLLWTEIPNDLDL